MVNDLRVLPPGTRLLEYEIEGVLGQGAFGITYLARCDVNQCQSAQKGKCGGAKGRACNFAIKEYFPKEYAARGDSRTVHPSGSDEDRETFHWGLERFRDEADTLVQLDHPNIVAVKRYFPANGTAYLVMDCYDGDRLDHRIKRDGPLPPDMLERVFLSLLDGLEHVHDMGIMHRDIKPANMIIRPDGSPVLLDFGAARAAIGEHSRTITSLITIGYGAYEQYSTRGSQQGPWTDIYGLAATLYHAATGTRPLDSFERHNDDTLVPLATAAAERYPGKQALLRVIDAGLIVAPRQRPQSVAAWRQMLTGSAPAQSQPEPPAGDRTLLMKPDPAPQTEVWTNPSSQILAPPPANTARVVLIIAGALLLLIAVAAFWPRESVDPTPIDSSADSALSAADTAESAASEAASVDAPVAVRTPEPAPEQAEPVVERPPAYPPPRATYTPAPATPVMPEAPVHYTTEGGN